MTRTLHGDAVSDPYAWLRDTDDPEVVAHLQAENAYTQAVMASTRELQRTLFEEIKGRIAETDVSAPVREDGWWYFSRTVEGLAHPIHCRRRDDGSGGAPQGSIEPGPPQFQDQVLIDENELASDTGFVSLGAMEVSPDATLLAWSVDVTGDESHELRVRDLVTGEDRPDRIENTSYGVAWSADGGWLLYTTLDAAQRPWQVWRHQLGTEAAADDLVLEEPDERFFVSVGTSRDRRWIVIDVSSKLTSECRLIDAAEPTAPPRLVRPRDQGVEYHVEPGGDDLFVLSNHDGPNFGLYRTGADSSGSRDGWTTVLAHRDDVRLEDVDAFAEHVVVAGREGGRPQLSTLDPDTRVTTSIPVHEETATVGPGQNPMFDTAVYRYHYESLVTPPSVYERNLDTGEEILRKRQWVGGGYDAAAYESHRLWAIADDGTKVPISVVHRAGLVLDGTAPCLLWGYGAYEVSSDPWFSASRLSLLERGFSFAIAHVRGGGELGRRWYEAGKLLAKPHSFGDFVACARHLVDTGYTSPDRLVARGGSAGGLLVGAAANLAPELFRAVVANVPFTDALNTICDPTLPLTVTEWEEWGNPLEDPDVYRLMKSYTPYENIRDRPYPAILATAGLNDTRVGAHEPAKWVARLRDVTTGDLPILLQTEMGAGHGGPTDRYDAWRREAFVLAFILTQVGLEQESTTDVDHR